MAGCRRAVVLHAYSRDNRGDGLLVDTAVEALHQRGFEHVTVVAAWPASFADLVCQGVDVVAWPHEPFGALRSAADLLIGRGPVAQAVAQADVVVGVGGGYLRAATVLEGVRTLAAHLPQLLAATRRAKTGTPVVYLPQSVGPYRGPAGWLLRACVRRLVRSGARLFCRDDLSIAETGCGERASDMVAGRFGAGDVALRAVAGAPVALVVRSLRDAPADYWERFRQLIALLAEDGVTVVGALGATAGGGNDDRACYTELGLDAVPLDDLFATRALSAVVSVRLHGALGAWEAGFPALHLSYERKGPAAYADLGVSDLCDDARRFDADEVAAKLRDMVRDPAAVWARVGPARRALAADAARVRAALPARR